MRLQCYNNNDISASVHQADVQIVHTSIVLHQQWFAGAVWLYLLSVVLRKCNASCILSGSPSLSTNILLYFFLFYYFIIILSFFHIYNSKVQTILIKEFWYEHMFQVKKN